MTPAEFANRCSQLIGRSADWLDAAGLSPGEHFAEPPLRERAEERIPGQFRTTGRWARDAREESRLLSWRAERVGVTVAQHRERVGTDYRLDRRLWLGPRKCLRASGQAVAAVPAGLRACLAEVAD